MHGRFDLPLHSEELRPLRQRRCGDLFRQPLGDGDRREHREEDAEAQGDGKAADDRGSDCEEDGAGDERTDVSVTNTGPSLLKAGLKARERATAPQFFFDALKDEDVRVHGHAGTENDTRHAGEREHHVLAREKEEGIFISTKKRMA